MEQLSASAITKKTNYIDQYDPNLLSAMNRDATRSGIDVQDLPFIGVDIWNGYDFTWLNNKDQPEYGMLTIHIPCASPNLVAAKSLKLYLQSFANTKFQSINEIISTITQDLSAIIGFKVQVSLANILLDFMRILPRFNGTNLDLLDVACDLHEVQAQTLTSDPTQIVDEQLCSDLLQFNSAITGKPDWGSIRISYTGPKIDATSLLKYIVSYRNQPFLQEQCIEKIYSDILTTCQPSKLLIEGRYTRRGGLELNPIRANMQFEQVNQRLFRQ